ncbi:hypothetical protein ACFFX0_15755 [Citricoccus parietis]|uniref:Uncharacterized protein n=1 Tax=Citricoccus parietis TaxID=592307 RepID=A0ABV5G0W3_9MICC
MTWWTGSESAIPSEAGMVMTRRSSAGISVWVASEWVAVDEALAAVEMEAEVEVRVGVLMFSRVPAGTGAAEDTGG